MFRERWRDTPNDWLDNNDGNDELLFAALVCGIGGFAAGEPILKLAAAAFAISAVLQAAMGAVAKKISDRLNGTPAGYNRPRMP